MSAFLGPIHHLLFEKIRFQSELTDAILKKIDDEQLLRRIGQDTSRLSEGDLKDIVDRSDIHGSLQNMISKEEHRLAYVVTTVQKEKFLSMEELLHIVQEYGEHIEKPHFSSVNEVYTFLSSKFLNGMPCDHVQEILEKTDFSLQYRDRLDIHKEYWEKVQGNVEDFYKIRESLISKLIGEDFSFFEMEPYVYVLSEKGKYFKDNISLLEHEHDNILRFIDLMRKSVVELMNNKDSDVSVFHDYIDFARNYADKHHHGKEEKVLFRYMTQHLGEAAVKLVENGMLVEHDFGRLYVKNLEESVIAFEQERKDEFRINIIANAVSYGDLLNRHIEKENQVVYPFAKRSLHNDHMILVEEETKAFEQEYHAVKEKYEQWLDRMEKNSN